LGLDATANEEITAIWAQVLERVRQLAQHEKKEVQEGLGIGDVIASLEASQAKEEESPTRQAVKTAFGRTMGLISTVGGIVSEGASTVSECRMLRPYDMTNREKVFAPAGQCYNAISFLIHAWEGYQGAFESLAVLLEQCSDHLGRLSYYVRGGMDAKLSHVAATQLLLFVNICDAALKLRYSRSEKIKTGLKIAFLDENSIQGLLGEMAKLAERERGLVSAQTFQLASAAATNAAEGAALGKQILDALVQSGAKQTEELERKGHKHSLMDVLAFDHDSDRWDSVKQEPVESWQTRYNDLRKTVVPGTGQWLLADPVFQLWGADFASSAPILGMEGTETTGKSYLTSSVVKHLRTDMATQHPEFRHLVAFDFIDRDKSGRGFAAVAKSLIWQLADKDEPYMKSTARICQRVGLLDPDDIIPQLLLDNTDLEHMNAIFYLVVDGLSDTLDNALLKFLRRASESRNKNIRIFLTGTLTAFAQIKKNGVVFRSIPISRKNHDDVEKFIDARMDKFDALSDPDRTGVTERRKKIREQLSQAAAGDYYKLNSALNTISTLDYMDDIKLVIQGAQEERSKQIHEEIQMLNKLRSEREIKEINQIILWITFAIEPVSEKHISAILYMSIGEAPLRPLAERFRTKYLLFEVNGKGYVCFRSLKALDVIPHRRQSNTPDRPQDQEIHSAEINIVTHFLDKVCPPDLYKKLEIEEYLKQKAIQKQSQIHQEDKDTAHILLTLDCLRALTEGSDASIAVLREYSRKHLIQHLSLVDLAMVDRESKSQIGKALIRLFTEKECIDTLMWPEYNDVDLSHAVSTVWVENDQKVNEVVRWFKDTAVLSGLPDEPHRSWARKVVSGNATEALLKPSVLRLIHHCLRETLSAHDAREIYRFVNHFLSKVSVFQCLPFNARLI
jgi:hypothetical protein